jgi:integrase
MPQYYDEENKNWKFRVYATDANGIRKQRERSGFKTKKEAKQAEEEFLKNFGKTPSDDMTFEELWNNFDEYTKLKSKAQTYRKTVSKVKNHLLPYFKDYKLNNITLNVYLDWQKKILEKGYSYSYSYKSSLHVEMVTMLNYAIKFFGLKENIAHKVGNFSKGNEIKKEMQVWTFEEYNKFISVIDDLVYRIFYETLYYTGIRIGECNALTWNDFKNGYLFINKTISKEMVDGKRVINSPKTDSSDRKVKLDDYLISTLNDFKKENKKIVGFKEEWFIFGGLKPLAPTTIDRRMKKYFEIADVKKIRIHDIRHSHTSLLISENAKITAVSKRLGHSNISTTLNIYSHLLPSDADEAVQSINNLRKEKAKETE